MGFEGGEEGEEVGFCWGREGRFWERLRDVELLIDAGMAVSCFVCELKR